MYISQINIAIATKRNFTVKCIVTLSVGCHVEEINRDVLSYNMKNVGETK
jgi:hypothetical protein